MGLVGFNTSIAIGTDGNPVISYRDSSNTALKMARCNDPACAGADETLSTVDETGSVGRDSSIAIGDNGNPVISHHDLSNNDLKVANVRRRR